MAWGVRWYLVGFIGFGVLGVLAGCSGGFLFAEREPWRHDAEVQCLNAGAVREGPGVVRVTAIRGPGVCGADFPFRVSVLGASSPLGYSDELRPPADIPRRSSSPPPRRPLRQPAEVPVETPRGAAPDQPISLSPPGVVDQPSNTPDSYDYRRPYGGSPPPRYGAPPQPVSPREDFSPEPYDRRPLVDAPAPPRGVTRTPLRDTPAPDGPRYGEPPPVAPLGPGGNSQVMTSLPPVAVSPTATLACPIVSELDRWISGAVQPAAMRWFGTPVAEIKQISAYSCRGMNGNPRASISEHAFGNALDIAAFILADGRKITVKNGWRGPPEEQGFLRDVQAAACEQFTTVLAPGSNVYHYDHIHVDLMRRRDGHRACNPQAVSGEEVAARAGARYGVRRADPAITGSLAPRRHSSRQSRGDIDDLERRERALPMAEPGMDGLDN
jgi:extensin-like protein